MPFTHAGLSEEGIIAEIIGIAHFRFFLTDPDETITVEIPLLRFSHGSSSFRQFGMGTFRSIFGICIDAGIVLAVMAVLR